MPTPPLTLPSVKDLFPEYLFEAAQSASDHFHYDPSHPFDISSGHDRSPTTQAAARLSDTEWTRRAYHGEDGPSQSSQSTPVLLREANIHTTSTHPNSNALPQTSSVSSDYSHNPDISTFRSHNIFHPSKIELPPAVTLMQDESSIQSVSPVYQFHPIYYDGPDEPHRGRGRSSHVPMYREEKRHICPHCDKRFNRPSSLRIHVNTHTGDKPFGCPHPGCGRQFNVSSNMRRHYMNHITSNTSPMSTPSTSPTSLYAPRLNDPHLSRGLSNSGSSTTRGTRRFIHHNHSASQSSEASSSWASESDMDSFESGEAAPPGYSALPQTEDSRDGPRQAVSSHRRFQYGHARSNARLERPSTHDGASDIRTHQTIFSASPMYTFPPPPAPASYQTDSGTLSTPGASTYRRRGNV